MTVTHRRRRVSALVAVACLMLFGCAEPVPERSRALPSRFFIEPSVERGPEGEIYITGSTNLPDGLRIGTEVPVSGKRSAQDFRVNVASGKFRSAGFSVGADPFPPGKRKVRFLAYFNEAWQNPALLRLVGRGGSNLAGELFKLEDPEVTDSDKILDATRTLDFPPLSREAEAVRPVKKAVLTVDGRRSAGDVETNIAWFMKVPGLKPAKGWSARADQTETYLVVCDFVNGKAGVEQAIWSVDLSTKRVAYVNRNAKTFSWTPDY